MTRRSGPIEVRMLHEPAEMATAERLLQRVWGSTNPPLEAATMTALAHAGNYVSGGFDDGELVGCAVGFFAPPAERSLHSHIAGVDAGSAGRGIGMALKSHQRQWCLERGTTSITWTFDPAIARNAHFNLTKLGVIVEGYLVDFYGRLDDELNAGSPTDRVFVRWDLEATAPVPVDVAASTPDALAVDGTGAPVVLAVDPSAREVLVRVPRDIEALRRTDPSLATDWRLALREVLGSYLGNGWQVAGFRLPDHYVLERTP